MKNVRTRFIIGTMLSALIVITIMMLVINFINYNNVDSFADTVTQTVDWKHKDCETDYSDCNSDNLHKILSPLT